MCFVLSRARQPQTHVLQVFSACAMSFVHGANDVANAMGPLSGVYQIWSTGEISSNVRASCADAILQHRPSAAGFESLAGCSSYCTYCVKI